MMFEEDGFTYKRLSIGNDAPVAAKKRAHKTRSDGPFFNFKFVNKAGDVPFAFARKDTRAAEKKSELRSEKQRVAEEKSAETRIVPKRVRADDAARNVQFDPIATLRDPLSLHTLLAPGATLAALAGAAVDFLAQRLGASPFLEQLRTSADVPVRNTREEIERVEMEMLAIDGESRKWTEIGDATAKSNFVSIDFTFQDFRLDEIKSRTERIKAVREEFRKKEGQVIFGLKNVDRVVAGVQAQGEDVFRRILRAVEGSKGYDSFVLLKAISKLGK